MGVGLREGIGIIMSASSVRTRDVTVGGAAITLSQRDDSRRYLLLHGGGGLVTMDGFADFLAARLHAQVLLPTHPGFGDTPRADLLSTTVDLAEAYIRLLDELDMSEVTVVGNSFGGWVAAEIALLGSPRVADVVIVDGIGIEVEGQPMANAAGLAPAELAKLSFHDPSKAPLPPAGEGPGPSPDILAMAAYAGPTLSDPTLLSRLRGVELPTHVIWGASDRIVTPEYGRVYADAIPGSTYTVLPAAGHLPQVEAPEELLRLLEKLRG